MSEGRARSVVVVSGGLGQPSSTRLLADRITAATERHLRDAGFEPATEIVELRDHAHDLTNHLLTGSPSPTLQAATDAVLAADGLIAVTPIFSASYSGLFKMFFDVIERGGFAGKPVLIAATGGTARHSLALEHAVRPLFAYLNAATVPTAVYARIGVRAWWPPMAGSSIASTAPPGSSPCRSPPGRRARQTIGSRTRSRSRTCSARARRAAGPPSAPGSGRTRRGGPPGRASRPSRPRRAA